MGYSEHHRIDRVEHELKKLQGYELVQRTKPALSDLLFFRANTGDDTDYEMIGLRNGWLKWEKKDDDNKKDNIGAAKDSPMPQPFFLDTRDFNRFYRNQNLIGRVLGVLVGEEVDKYGPSIVDAIVKAHK